jgi:acyl-CoA dehydrogenase
MTDIRQIVSDSVNHLFASEITDALLRAFDAGTPATALWSLVEEAGFADALSADAGSGADWTMAWPILHAIGYHRAPLPLAETVVANWLLAKAGLPRAGGPATLVDGQGLDLVLDGGRPRSIGGVARRVPWGGQAKTLVIDAAIGGQAWILLVQGGLDRHIRIASSSNVACEPRDTLTFERCPIAAAAPLAAAPLRPVETFGALMRAVTMAGAAESVLDQAVRYANERVQFGRPIGRFQAIQHMLADLAAETTAAMIATSIACEATGTANARITAAIAKTRTGHTAMRAGRIAHQVIGAIGFTYEFALQFGTRRLWSWRSEFGHDAYWAEVIGSAAIAAGGKAFWPNLTAMTAGSAKG